MYAITAFLISSIFASTILAAPGANVNLSTRTCSAASPIIARVGQARPDAFYRPEFIISQDEGAINKQDVFIEFDIPPGSYGCQLEVQFPADFLIHASGQTQVDLYSTEENLPRSPRGIFVSWFKSPAPVSQVATVKFEDGPTNKKALNSFVCKPRMTFRLSIAKDQTAAGSVAFEHTAGVGLTMKYNC